MKVLLKWKGDCYDVVVPTKEELEALSKCREMLNEAKELHHFLSQMDSEELDNMYYTALCRLDNLLTTVKEISPIKFNVSQYRIDW